MITLRKKLLNDISVLEKEKWDEYKNFLKKLQEIRKELKKDLTHLDKDSENKLKMRNPKINLESFKIENILKINKSKLQGLMTSLFFEHNDFMNKNIKYEECLINFILYLNERLAKGEKITEKEEGKLKHISKNIEVNKIKIEKTKSWSGGFKNMSPFLELHKETKKTEVE